MNFYEYLPHEYSYALYLADIYDLYPFDSMIHNMVSERYPRDEDEDRASAYDSEYCEEDESDDVEILSNSPQDLESSTSSNSLVFGSFTSPIIPVFIPSIASDFDGFSIKIGAITCFLSYSCCNDVDFAITASEEHKQSKNFETEFVLSEVDLKLQNQFSVQAFSSPIKVKRKHDGNVRFSQDQDQNSKKGEILSDLLLPSSQSITLFTHHRGLCITVFDPGGVVVKPLSIAKVLDDYGEILLREPQSHDEGKTGRAIFIFDPGGKTDCCNFWYSPPLILLVF
ncbi:unnamed protein product [Trifolium pratense]|uniref:Uncharacterized protein n=1 Tax=Trifolium pratense TaxID=57577 RepID=A0ACB0IVU9_TRIPR|nr:unnamed protein product [Trifolium pratense]